MSITAAVTSAFWLIVGGWLYSRHLHEHGRAPGPAVLASPASTSATAVSRSSQAVRTFAEQTPAPARAARSGETIPASALLVPVAGVKHGQLSDTFAEGRAAGERSHDAIDIMAPEGTPVIAAASGTVEKLFVSPDGGNTVYIRSPDRRTLYYYAHLRDYAPDLAEGAQIERGVPLGSVGHSGNADPAAPHLHFAIFRTVPEREWWEEGTPINPYPLLRHRR